VAKRIGHGYDNATVSAGRAPLQVSSYQFEDFELDLRRYELRRDGLTLRLERIPMELLILLLSRNGELVSREEIVEKLWGKDVFVETEHSVNTAVRKIRQALADDPESPRFVKTIKGKGYRFAGNISFQPGGSRSEPVEMPGEVVMPHEIQQRLPGNSNVVETLSSRRHRFTVPLEKVISPRAPVLAPEPPSKGKPVGAVWIVVGVILSLLFLVLGIWHTTQKPMTVSLPSLEVVPLVGLDGAETRPAFSPDGNQIVFALRSEKSSGIYSTLVAGGKPLRLTRDPSDGYPKWSPDGQQVAFSRRFREGVAIYALPALGGIERKLYDGPATAFSHAFDWSPDGKFLAISQGEQDKTHARIALLSVTDAETRPLTTPSEQDLDIEPAFSPDGSTVAFVRSNVGGMVSELFVVPAGGGEAKRLTFDHRNICGSLAWTPDGKEILFSSSRSGSPSLWRVSASGGTPQPTSGGSVDATSPTISLKGNQLAYEQKLFQDDIWRLDLTDKKLQHGTPVPVIRAPGMNIRPQYSPDGKKIAFQSSRSGYSEIWMCDSDGSNCGSLTSLQAVAGAPRWSPDGHYLAFDSHPKAYTEIYVMAVDGGPPRLLTTFPGVDNGGPNWSRDGRWIYFYSNRERGLFQLWKVQLGGGPPIQVTKKGGIFGIESADGRFLYFAKFEAPGLWRMPLNGGEETPILDQPGGDVEWCNWALVKNGIYFLDWGSESQGRKASIQFFDLTSRLSDRSSL
jgi:Tol biopolymer transport system component/DNA-binding winged helix-turn-helix (wHTH) protein